jgi:hypothetical protein
MSKIIKNIVTSNFACLKRVNNSYELFHIDFKVLKFFGHHPMNGRKVLFGVFTEFCLMFIPNLTCMIKSIMKKDSKSISLSAIEVLINLFCLTSTISFWYNYENLKNFLNDLNCTWKINEGNEKWEEIKKKRSRFCNRMSFWGQFWIHINGIVYFFIPSFIFLYKRYFTSSSETYSVFMVE